MIMVPAIILASDATGLGVLRSLGEKKVPCIIVTVSESDLSNYSRYVSKRHVVSGWKDWAGLKEIFRKYEGNNAFIIATNDIQVALLSENRDYIDKNFRMLGPSHKIIDILNDKGKELPELEARGIIVPEFYQQDSFRNIDKFRYPVIVKPRTQEYAGQLGYKNKRLKNIDEARAYTITNESDLSKVIIQSVIQEGEVWAAYCLFDSESELVSIFTFHRIRTSPAHFGVTSFAVSKINHELVEIVRKTGKVLNYSGLMDIEFIKDASDGVYKYIEINPRIGMCAYFDSRAGVGNVYNAYLLAMKKHERTSTSQKQNIYYLSLLEDIYARYKDKERPGEIVIDCMKMLLKNKTGLYLSIYDPMPVLVYMYRKMLEHIRGAIRKIGIICY